MTPTRTARAAARLAALALALLAGPVAGPAAAEYLFPDLSPAGIPNFVGLGIGAYPDYVGSGDLALGAAPFGRLSRGNRYIDFQVSFATANLLDHPAWRLGPTAQWRFGRGDVDSPAVSALPDIDGSLELGAFAAYERVGADPRDRWRAGLDFGQAVTGGHDGFIVAASLRRWQPVGRFAALGLSLGTTYGSAGYLDTYFSVTPTASTSSGLPVFDAGAGFRDIRTTVVFVQPISPEWQIGAGLLYARLLGDVADSPVVADAGARDQIVFGLGVGRAF